MRDISKKNYVFLALLIFLSVGIIIGIRNIYIDQKDSNIEPENVMSFLQQINEDELYNYLMENRETYLYVSSNSIESQSQFYKQFKDYVVKKELSKDIVYIDLDNVSENFYSAFKERYFSDTLKNSNVELIKQANVLAAQNGKIVKILYSTESTMKINDVKKFINGNMSGE